MKHLRAGETVRRTLTWLLAAALVGGLVPAPALAEMTDEQTEDATVVETSDEEAESPDEAPSDDAASPDDADSDAEDPAAADSDVPVDDAWFQEYATGGVSDPVQVPSVFDGDEDADLEAQASLPSRYLGYDYNTCVKDQNPFGTCWAFAAIAAVEASMLKRGPRLGYTVDSLDLSERHLAYFTFNVPQDPLHNTDGDKILPRADGSKLGSTPPCYLNNAGSLWLTSNALWSKIGAVDEEVAPYADLCEYYWDNGYNKNYTSLLANTALSPSLGRQGFVRLKNARIFNMSDVSEVKRAVMDYGAAGVAFYYNSNYLSYDAGRIHYYYNGDKETSHLITIIGWDDSIKTSVFGANSGARPKKNGAWFCKNSWGDLWGPAGGYFWLSYEDVCLLRQNAYVFEMEQDGLYDNLYQYDGSPSDYVNSIESGGSIANVFEAKANAKGEQLKAISFFAPDVNLSYSCQIYLDPTKANDPTSGVAALSKPVTGTMTNAGITRVELPSAVTLAPGVKFSVVVTLKHTKGADQVQYAVDATSPSDNWCRFTSAVTPGQSFERDTAKSAWQDLATITKPDKDDEPKCCARIKAHTTNYNMGNKLRLNNADVTVDSQAYTGKALTPNPKVVIADHTLRKDVDYTLTYKNNVNVGTATVTIRGKGSYSGSKSVTFTIRPFKDVTEETSHAEDILWLADQDISGGWTEKDGTRTFRPNADVKRGDMAAFLFRLAKRWGEVSESWRPESYQAFTDVTADTSHAREILWLAEMGISTGWKTSKGREFRPNESVKRGDMAAFMYRLATKSGRWGYGSSSTRFFRDVTSSTSFHDEIWWLAGNGVTQGWGSGSAREYRPNDTVKRGDMAAFLHRLDGVW